MITFIGLTVLGIATLGCVFTSSHESSGGDGKSPKRKDKVVLTDAEWKKKLTPEQYTVLRHGATERPFCGAFLDNHKTGAYLCAGCDLPLFKSDNKFDSGTGWPSFFQPYSKENVWTRSDDGFGMIRTEILCARCDGHLGHVFDDGPKPTGLRFCVNSESLKFVENYKEPAAKKNEKPQKSHSKK